MTVPVFSLHELSRDLKITDLHLQNLDKATRFHSKILLKHISPSSVVGSSRNFRVESKIELNLLEGLLARKKTWVDIPDRLQFFLSSVFKMADFCYGSLVNQKSMSPNMDSLYITG